MGHDLGHTAFGHTGETVLDEILQDPNMPSYTRVRLYNVMSRLEAIKD